MTEAKIQYQICEYLQLRRLYFFSIANEAAGRSRIAQMQLVSMGLRAGVADLEVWLPDGVTLYLEVKTATGRQSPRQKKFQERCEQHGRAYHIVRSVEDVERVLAECGV